MTRDFILEHCPKFKSLLEQKRKATNNDKTIQLAENLSTVNSLAQVRTAAKDVLGVNENV